MYRIKKSVLSYRLMELALIILVFTFLGYRALSLENIKNVLRVLAVLLVIFSAWLDGLEKIQLNKIELLSLLIGGETFILSGFCTLNFMVILVVVICAKRYSMEEFIHMCTNANAVGVLVYIIGCISGNIVWEPCIVGDRIRNNLGFSNVNAASMFFFSVVILWILNQPNKFRFFVGTMFMAWIYFMTNSRTSIVGYLVFTGICIFELITGYLKRGKNLLHGFLKMMIAGLPVLFSAIIFFAQPLMERFPELDRILSNRLSIMEYVVGSLSVRNILLGGAAFEVDSVYVNLLSSGGIVLLVFIVGLVVYAVRRITDYKKNVNVIFAMVCAVVLMSVVEDLWFRPEILVSLVFWKYIYEMVGKKLYLHQ